MPRPLRDITRDAAWAVMENGDRDARFEVVFDLAQVACLSEGESIGSRSRETYLRDLLPRWRELAQTYDERVPRDPEE